MGQLDVRDWRVQAPAELIDQFQHDARAWGENLAWGSSAAYNGLEGLTAWYNEKPFFLPVTSKCSAGNVCGHYTQVISQLSRQVGCATASEPNGVSGVPGSDAMPHSHMQ